jgi:hypothetical protein
MYGSSVSPRFVLRGCSQARARSSAGLRAAPEDETMQASKIPRCTGASMLLLACLFRTSYHYNHLRDVSPNEARPHSCRRRVLVVCFELVTITIISVLCGSPVQVVYFGCNSLSTLMILPYFKKKYVVYTTRGLLSFICKLMDFLIVIKVSQSPNYCTAATHTLVHGKVTKSPFRPPLRSPFNQCK